MSNSNSKKQVAKKNKLFKKLNEKFKVEKENQLTEDASSVEDGKKEEENILKYLPYFKDRVGYFRSNFSPNDIAEFTTIH